MIRLIRCFSLRPGNLQQIKNVSVKGVPNLEFRRFYLSSERKPVRSFHLTSSYNQGQGQGQGKIKLDDQNLSSRNSSDEDDKASKFKFYIYYLNLNPEIFVGTEQEKGMTLSQLVSSKKGPFLNSKDENLFDRKDWKYITFSDLEKILRLTSQYNYFSFECHLIRQLMDFCCLTEIFDRPFHFNLNDLLEFLNRQGFTYNQVYHIYLRFQGLTNLQVNQKELIKGLESSATCIFESSLNDIKTLSAEAIASCVPESVFSEIYLRCLFDNSISNEEKKEKLKALSFCFEDLGSECIFLVEDDSFLSDSELEGFFENPSLFVLEELLKLRNSGFLRGSLHPSLEDLVIFSSESKSWVVNQEKFNQLVRSKIKEKQSLGPFLKDHFGPILVYIGDDELLFCLHKFEEIEILLEPRYCSLEEIDIEHHPSPDSQRAIDAYLINLKKKI